MLIQNVWCQMVPFIRCKITRDADNKQFTVGGCGKNEFNLTYFNERNTHVTYIWGLQLYFYGLNLVYLTSTSVLFATFIYNRSNYLYKVKYFLHFLGFCLFVSFFLCSLHLLYSFQNGYSNIQIYAIIHIIFVVYMV